MCHYYSPRVGPESRRYTRDANTDEASTCRRGELMAQYINYVFFKLDLMWHRLPEEERGQGKRKFLRTFEEHKAAMLLRSFSFMGLRSDADFIL